MNVTTQSTRASGGARAFLVGITLVLVLTSFLGVVMIVGSTAQPAATASGALTRTAGGVTFSLEAAPAALGPNRILVTARDGQGRPLVGARMTLLLAMRDMPMGATTLAAAPVGGGRYQAMATLSMPGHWEVTAIATGGGLSRLGARTSFLLTADAHAARPVPTALPLLAGAVAVAGPGAPVQPGAVRWTGLPFPAAVSFLGNGLVYLPGRGSLLRVGQLNHSLIRAPDGTLWVLDYLGNRVAVIAPGPGRVVASIPVGVGPVHAVFSPDGRRAYVSDFVSNEVSVVDVRARRVLASVTVGMHPHGLAISPDGRQVWVPCSGAGGLWVVDTRTNAVVGAYAAGLLPHAATFSPDGRTVYMTDAGPGTLVVLERASGKVRARIPVGTGSAMTVAGPGGRYVYVTGQSGAILTVIDPARGAVVARVPVGSAPHGLTFTPDGRLLYVAVNNARHVAVVDTRTNRVTATVAVPGQADEVALTR